MDLLYCMMSFIDSSRNTPVCFPLSLMHQCLQAFSLQTTSQGVLSTSSSTPGAAYSSLSGIRALSLLWIISGHSAQFPLITNLGMKTCISFYLQCPQSIWRTRSISSVLSAFENFISDAGSLTLMAFTSTHISQHLHLKNIVV